MKNILDLATLYLALFGFGCSLVLPFFPLPAAGVSFVRYMTGQNLFFQLLFLACLQRSGRTSTAFFVIVGLSAWTWGVGFLKPVISRIGLFLVRALAAVSFLFLIFFQHTFLLPAPHSFELGWVIATFFLSSIFLSAFITNMIFGHWYLTNRELDIIHLIRSSRALLFITYARLASVALSVGVAATRLDSAAWHRLTDLMGHGVFFWARLLTGLVVPLTVAHLSYAAAKIKSNQSATGILYAGCVFVIMGELIALYLYMLTGVAF